jgi:hypothetical protein
MEVKLPRAYDRDYKTLRRIADAPKGQPHLELRGIGRILSCHGWIGRLILSGFGRAMQQLLRSVESIRLSTGGLQKAWQNWDFATSRAIVKSKDIEIDKLGINLH